MCLAVSIDKEEGLIFGMVVMNDLISLVGQCIKSFPYMCFEYSKESSSGDKNI